MSDAHTKTDTRTAPEGETTTKCAPAAGAEGSVRRQRFAGSLSFDMPGFERSLAASLPQNAENPAQARPATDDRAANNTTNEDGPTTQERLPGFSQEPTGSPVSVLSCWSGFGVGGGDVAAETDNPLRPPPDA